MTDTSTERVPKAWPHNVAQQVAVEALTVAQRNWLALDGDAINDSTTMRIHINQATASFGLGLFLTRLNLSDPAEAQIAVTEYQEALQDGSGVGEWIWELLSSYGHDPASLIPAADPRGDLREELARLRGEAGALRVTVQEMPAAHDDDLDVPAERITMWRRTLELSAPAEAAGTVNA